MDIRSMSPAFFVRTPAWSLHFFSGRAPQASLLQLGLDFSASASNSTRIRQLLVLKSARPASSPEPRSPTTAARSIAPARTKSLSTKVLLARGQSRTAESRTDSRRLRQIPRLQLHAAARQAIPVARLPLRAMKTVRWQKSRDVPKRSALLPNGSPRRWRWRSAAAVPARFRQDKSVSLATPANAAACLAHWPAALPGPRVAA